MVRSHLKNGASAIEALRKAFGKNIEEFEDTTE